MALLSIQPLSLNFPPPYDTSSSSVITKTLRLSNIDSRSVAFKVKTTAPTRYTVRPNTGLLLPGEHREIKVMLNISKDPPPNFPAISDFKDKFQVQALAVDAQQQQNEDEVAVAKRLWQNTPDKKGIKKFKLTCTFQPEPSPASSASKIEVQPPKPSEPGPSDAVVQSGSHLHDPAIIVQSEIFLSQTEPQPMTEPPALDDTQPLHHPVETTAEATSHSVEPTRAPVAAVHTPQNEGVTSELTKLRDSHNKIKHEHEELKTKFQKLKTEKEKKPAPTLLETVENHSGFALHIFFLVLALIFGYLLGVYL